MTPAVSGPTTSATSSSGPRSGSTRPPPRSPRSPTRCRRSSTGSRCGCARSWSTSTARASPSTRPTATPFSIDSRRCSGTRGRRSRLSNRFQVANCGSSSTARSSSLKLTGGDQPPGPPGDPRGVHAEGRGSQHRSWSRSRCRRASSSTTRTSATSARRPQFAADACPPASRLGIAEAGTPLLDSRSRAPSICAPASNKLPDLGDRPGGPDRHRAGRQRSTGQRADRCGRPSRRSPTFPSPASSSTWPAATRACSSTTGASARASRRTPAPGWSARTALSFAPRPASRSAAREARSASEPPSRGGAADDQGHEGEAEREAQRSRSAWRSAPLSTAMLGTGTAHAGLTNIGGFGGSGTGAGQFSPNEFGPAGIAYSEFNDHVYVADPGQHRVAGVRRDRELRPDVGPERNQTPGDDVCEAGSGDVCKAGARAAIGGAFNDPQGVAVNDSDRRASTFRMPATTGSSGSAPTVSSSRCGVGRSNSTTGGNLCTAASGNTCVPGIRSGRQHHLSENPDRQRRVRRLGTGRRLRHRDRRRRVRLRHRPARRLQHRNQGPGPEIRPERHIRLPDRL